MQNVTFAFKQLYGDILSHVELRARIDDETDEQSNPLYYTTADIYGCEISRNICKDDKPEIGGANAAELKLSVVPRRDIPRGAKVVLELRYVSGTSCSEWIPKGTFFVDTRETTFGNLVTTLNCFDAMLSAEQTYIQDDVTETWPQTESTIVGKILQRMWGNVTLDSRVTLKDYNVEYPNDLTCREILGYIAAANGGNWTITDENKLMLVKLAYPKNVLSTETPEAISFFENVITFEGQMPFSDYALSNTQNQAISFYDTIITAEPISPWGSEISPNHDDPNIRRRLEEYNKQTVLDPYNKVIVWYDDEKGFIAPAQTNGVDNEVVSGNDEGYTTLEIDCPWGTQQMANDLLGYYAGLQYKSYEVSHAAISPAAEMGDIVVFDGHAMPLLEQSVSIGGGYYPDIAAPDDGEVDSEYPYVTRTQKEIERRVKLGADYYGVKITRKDGITIEKTDGSTTKSRAKFNSDYLEFYDDDGNQALYFDINSGTYMFKGTMNVNNGQFTVDTDGHVSINSGEFHIGGTAQAPNFNVDQSGNLTTKGNLNAEGNNTVKGYFGVRRDADNLNGYMGATTGTRTVDGQTQTTYGVALCHGSPDQGAWQNSPYVVVTDGGCRMQSDSSNIYVTNTDARITVGGMYLQIKQTLLGTYIDFCLSDNTVVFSIDSDGKAYYHGDEVATV